MKETAETALIANQGRVVQAHPQEQRELHLFKVLFTDSALKNPIFL